MVKEDDWYITSSGSESDASALNNSCWMKDPILNWQLAFFNGRSS